MGKMIDAQSIVVASTATEWYGHEGDILRYVFFHSVALAALVGIMVTLQAYVFPFTRLVIRRPRAARRGRARWSTIISCIKFPDCQFQDPSASSLLMEDVTAEME